MNIDIAESLIETWLHVCKNCQVVQNKWTISTTWDEINEDIISKRKNDVINMIKKDTYFENILERRTLDTIFKQAECDLIGTKYDKDVKEFYIVETAFHEKGLHYNKNGEKNNERIYKKLLIEGLIFYVYVAPFLDKNTSNNLYLIFTSPKANDLTKYKDNIEYKQLNEFVSNLYNSDESSNIKVFTQIIVNDQFKNDIYIPIIKKIKENNINSELFARSMKLIQTIDDSFKYTDILKQKTDDKVQ